MFATTSAFALGGGVGAAWAMLATGVGPVKIVVDFFRLRTAVDENTVVRTGGDFFQVVPLRLLTNFTVGSIGPVLTVAATLLALAVPAVFFRRRDQRLRPLLLIEIVVLGYVAGFLFIGQIYLEGSYARLFVPLIGPTLSFALCGAYLLLRRFGRAAPLSATVAIAAVALVGVAPWSFARPPVSLHRIIYDALKDRITPARKLLLPACFGLDADYVGLASHVYFGDLVFPIYLMGKAEAFDELIAENHIGYVLVSTRYPLRGMWPRDRMLELFADTYGMSDVAPLHDLPRLPQDVWRGDSRVEWTAAACDLEASALKRLDTSKNRIFCAG